MLWLQCMIIVISIYNPPNNFFGLSLDKTDHVIQNRTMVIRRYPPSDLISVVWFYFDGIKAKKRASVQAKLLIGHGKQKNTFCRSQWRKKLKRWLTIPHKETQKIHKICRNDLRAFALRNYSEGYKINKPFSGLLVHRRIMPSAERLSSKFHSCPRSFASRPTVHFSDNLSALGIILRYTSRRKGFIH